MATSASPPSDVRDWLVTPAPFNTTKRGVGAGFSGDNSVVERREAEYYFDECVVYTRDPLPLGHVWQTTILNTTWRWVDGGLTVGVMSAPPESVPGYLSAGVSTNKWFYDCFDLSSGGTVGLLVTTSGDLYRYVNGRTGQRVATGLPVNDHLFGAADVYGNCSKIKSEMLSVPPKLILQTALRDGFISHKDDMFLFHGPGGVGKSSIIDMFLGKTRDLTRNSTQLVPEPLHLQPIQEVSNIREISTSLFTADWQVVNYEHMSRMIAHTSDQLVIGDKKVMGNEEKEIEEKEDVDGKSDVKVKGDAMRRVTGRVGKEGEEATSSISSGAFLAVPTVTKSPKKVDVTKIASRFLSTLSNIARKSPKSITTTLGNDPDNIEGIFASFQQDLHDFIRESRDANDVLFAHSIRILDSGGQPQFHELVSIFLPGITGIISVFKLSECLAVRGEVAFYDQGRCVNEPYESYYSNEQVIRHDLQVIQSEAARTGMEEMPNFAFIGTFLDQQDACPETPDEKDERLHTIITEVLPEKMQESVITNGSSLKQVTFRVNARTPEKRDFEAVGRLKGALVSRSRAQSRNLPLKWHGYEVALRRLMKELSRQSLRRNECEFIGYKLGFDLASLNAALDYLRKLNIISFYDVLPDVIFGSSQVVLDKITELVLYGLELKKGKYIAGGAERKFVQQGIISLEFLKSPALSKHYAPELFKPEDLLQILISQLVVSEVSKKEYIVPCVLEVNSVYPSPPLSKGFLHSSFIFLFSKKSPMCGVYCCTIASLLSDAGWKLLTEGGEVVQVARNSVTFEMPKGIPGKVVFQDPLSFYLEVIIEFPAWKQSKKLYHEIRNTFLVSIKRAMETLHYEVRAPKVSFLCPEQSSRCSVLPHPATVDDSQTFLKCSLKPGSVGCPLTNDQMMWLLKVTGRKLGGKLPIVKHSVAMPVPAIANEKVSDRDLAIIGRDHLSDWKALRPFLGLSRPQEREIVQSYPTDYGKQKQECLAVWKEMKGKEATYQALIQAAEDAKAQNLADSVRAMHMKPETALPPHMGGVATSHQLHADGDEPFPYATTQQGAPTLSECAGLTTHEQYQGTRSTAHAGLTSFNNDHIESSSDTDGQSSQLNSLQVQGGEESPQQHKPPTQSTKPVASTSSEHGSLQVHEGRADPSSDYHLPQTNQEQTSHSSEATRPQVHKDRDEQRKKPPREKTTFTDSTPPSTDQPPSLPKLFRLKIHQEVAPHFKIFGTFLLNDETGSRVNSMEEECLRKPEKVVTKILEEWIAGRGKPLTWETLIKTLRDCDLNPLADEVEDFIATL